MPVRLPVLLIGVCLTWPGASAAAEAPRGGGPAEGGSKAPSYISLMQQPRGGRVLVVDYPWRLLRRPSVEVRLVTGKSPGRYVVRPLFFVRQYMKGEVMVALYRCEDEAARGKVRESLTAGQAGFEILGGRNQLGKPAVCVVHRFAEDQPAPGATAIFCLLADWAINERLLYLDLSPEDFAQPGQLHVWFLREETVLWQQTLDWPGYGKQGETKHE